MLGGPSTGGRPAVEPGDMANPHAMRPGLHELILAQDGAISRRQLVELGLNDKHIAAQLSGGRWRRVRPGVYFTFTGPARFRAHAWAALLYAGAGAAASGETAAFLSGLRDRPPAVIEVSVDEGRRVANHVGCDGGPALRVRRVRGLHARRHPSRLPPQTRTEDTVLDLIDQATDADRVVSLITGSCQRRLTTAVRLEQCAKRRPRLRWRVLIGDVLADVRDGVQSPLERRWRLVERAHGLPAGQRNRAEGGPDSRCYRDVHYVEYTTVVELDGDAAHPTEDRELDRARDNDVAETAQVTLRYGWRAVAGTPCASAAQVGRVLTSRGWRGPVRRCGPDCSVEGGS